MVHISDEHSNTILQAINVLFRMAQFYVIEKYDALAIAISNSLIVINLIFINSNT